MPEYVQWLSDAANEEYRTVKAENERLRSALSHLMEFGKRLMNSEIMEERGIGCCICEGARIIEDDDFQTRLPRLIEENREALKRLAE